MKIVNKDGEVVDLRRQLTAALVATIGTFSHGTVFGWSSVCNPQLRQDFKDVTDSKIAWIASLPILAAFVGGPLGGFAMNHVGRKLTLMLFSIPSLVGWFTICAAVFLEPYGLFLFYIGRLVTGFCAGAFLVVVPAYVKEVAEDSARGILGSLIPLMMVTGILYCFVIGAFTEWLVTSACCMIPPLCLCAGALLIPESPKFLVSKGRRDSAAISLKWLRKLENRDKALRALAEMYPVGRTKSRHNHNKTWTGLFTRPVATPWLIMVVIMFFQQFGGVNAITLYTVEIFEHAGNFVDPRVATIIVGVVQVFFVALSMFLIDAVGRKLLLLVCSAIMGVSLAGLGAYFYIKAEGQGKEESLGWLPITTVSTFLAAYSTGTGSVPWVLGTEILNPDYKAESYSLMNASYWLTGFVVAYIYEDLRNGLREYGSFWLFAGFCVTFCVFILIFVPETKGKTNDDILRMFGATPATGDLTSEEEEIGEGDSEMVVGEEERPRKKGGKRKSRYGSSEHRMVETPSLTPLYSSHSNNMVSVRQSQSQGNVSRKSLTAIKSKTSTRHHNKDSES